MQLRHIFGASFSANSLSLASQSETFYSGTLTSRKPSPDSSSMSRMKQSNFHRQRSKEALGLIIQNNKILLKGMTSHYFGQMKSQCALQPKVYVLKQRSVLLLILWGTSTNKP